MVVITCIPDHTGRVITLINLVRLYALGLYSLSTDEDSPTSLRCKRGRLLYLFPADRLVSLGMPSTARIRGTIAVPPAFILAHLHLT